MDYRNRVKHPANPPRDKKGRFISLKKSSHLHLLSPQPSTEPIDVEQPAADSNPFTDLAVEHTSRLRRKEINRPVVASKSTLLTKASSCYGAEHASRQVYLKLPPIEDRLTEEQKRILVALQANLSEEQKRMSDEIDEEAEKKKEVLKKNMKNVYNSAVCAMLGCPARPPGF